MSRQSPCLCDRQYSPCEESNVSAIPLFVWQKTFSNRSKMFLIHPAFVTDKILLEKSNVLTNPVCVTDNILPVRSHKNVLSKPLLVWQTIHSLQRVKCLSKLPFLLQTAFSLRGQMSWQTPRLCDRQYSPSKRSNAVVGTCAIFRATAPLAQT